MIEISDGMGFWLTVALVMAVGSTLQAAVGFGFNLLATPVLVYLYRDPAVAVPALILAWYPVGLALSMHNRRQIDYPRIAWWIGPALPGALVGVWLLRDLDAEVMRRIVGAVTVISAVAITLRFTWPVRREWPWMLGTGGMSGVLAGSTGLSGPPVVLFGINQGWDTRKLRATLFLYFTALTTFTLICLIYEAMLTAPVIEMALAGVPGMVFGFFAGSALAPYLHGHLFRRIAIVLLVFAGIMPWLR